MDDRGQTFENNDEEHKQVDMKKQSQPFLMTEPMPFKQGVTYKTGGNVLSPVTNMEEGMGTSPQRMKEQPMMKQMQTMES